jgi:Flp pilus assembly protein protease CpaA
LIFGDGILFLTSFSNGGIFSDGGAFIMGGGDMELVDSMLTAIDNRDVVFMILVVRVLMVLVAALTWQTVDNGGAIHTSPFLIMMQDNASIPLAFSVGAPIL